MIVINTETNITPINEDLNVVKHEAINIKNLIYCIRGKQVMLDSDVAMLYHYETKRINETVSRNKGRFPENFCFQLTQHEIEVLKSQIATSNENENMWSQFATSSKNETRKQLVTNRERNRKYAVAICDRIQKKIVKEIKTNYHMHLLSKVLQCCQVF